MNVDVEVPNKYFRPLPASSLFLQPIASVHIIPFSMPTNRYLIVFILYSNGVYFYDAEDILPVAG